VAIITGASPPPPPASGPTIIKPQPGSPVQPLPEPSPTFDDDDTGADGSTENPYLSLLGDGPATLTDSAGSTATAGDDGREFPWLIGALVLVVGLVGFLLFRRS
jgi:hypothetical protein